MRAEVEEGLHNDAQEYNQLFCVVCCHGFLKNPSKEGMDRSGQLSKFIEEVLSSSSSSKFSSIQSTSSWSICSGCLPLIKIVLGNATEVKAIEGVVKSLQIQVLQELEDLTERLAEYSSEMEAIQAVAATADVSGLDAYLKRTGTSHCEKVTSTVLRFRNRISQGKVKVEDEDSRLESTSAGTDVEFENLAELIMASSPLTTVKKGSRRGAVDEARAQPCPECDQSFKNEWTLARHWLFTHLAILPSIRCPAPYCKTEMTRIDHLRTHIRKSHGADAATLLEVISEGSSIPGSKMCVYPNCDTPTKSKTALYRHIKSVHNPKDVELRNVKRSESETNASRTVSIPHESMDNGKIKCTFENCGVILSRKSNLPRHFRRVHQSKGIKVEAEDDEVEPLEEEFSDMCFLCCCSINVDEKNNSQVEKLSDNFQFNQFVGEVLQADDDLHVDMLTSLDLFSVCSECRALVDCAMERKMVVDEGDIKLREDQSQILCEMKKLTKSLESYSLELGGIKKKVEGSDMSSLEPLFERTGKHDIPVVLELRDRIFSVASELDKARGRLEVKCGLREWEEGQRWSERNQSGDREEASDDRLKESGGEGDSDGEIKVAIQNKRRDDSNSRATAMIRSMRFGLNAGELKQESSSEKQADGEEEVQNENVESKDVSLEDKVAPVEEPEDEKNTRSSEDEYPPSVELFYTSDEGESAKVEAKVVTGEAEIAELEVESRVSSVTEAENGAAKVVLVTEAEAGVIDCSAEREILLENRVNWAEVEIVADDASGKDANAVTPSPYKLVAVVEIDLESVLTDKREVDEEKQFGENGAALLPSPGNEQVRVSENVELGINGDDDKIREDDINLQSEGTRDRLLNQLVKDLPPETFPTSNVSENAHGHSIESPLEESDSNRKADQNNEDIMRSAPDASTLVPDAVPSAKFKRKLIRATRRRQLNHATSQQAIGNEVSADPHHFLEDNPETDEFQVSEVPVLLDQKEKSMECSLFPYCAIKDKDTPEIGSVIDAIQEHISNEHSSFLPEKSSKKKSRKPRKSQAKKAKEGKKKKLKCERCDLRFKKERALAKHLRKEHWVKKKTKVALEDGKSRNKNDARGPELYSSLTLHRCGTCTRCFTQLRNLREHEKLHSGNGERRLCLCSRCGEHFLGVTTLEKHQKRFCKSSASSVPPAEDDGNGGKKRKVDPRSDSDGHDRDLKNKRRRVS